MSEQEGCGRIIKGTEGWTRCGRGREDKQVFCGDINMECLPEVVVAESGHTDGWRSMDTVPRDATTVLLWYGQDFLRMYSLGAFHPDSKPTATAWMSLPAPPSEKGDGR